MRDNSIYYVFSTDQTSLNQHDNDQNAWNTLLELEKREMIFTRGQGSYKGVKENSFLVKGEFLDKVYVERVCKKYNQECFLMVYSDNSTYSVDLKTGKESYLGKMLTSDATKIRDNQDYSLFNNVIFQIDGV